MLNGTHTIAGFAAGLIANQTLSLPASAYGEVICTAIMAGAGILGSLVPDIDDAKSAVSQRSLILFILYTPFRWFDKLFCTKLFSHRKFTHTLLIPIAIIIMLMFVNMHVLLSYMITGVVAGYLSHLFLDMFNPAGIPMFFPFSTKMIRLLPKKRAIRAGSFAETFIMSSLLLSTAAYLIFFIGPQIFGLSPMVPKINF